MGVDHIQKKKATLALCTSVGHKLFFYCIYIDGDNGTQSLLKIDGETLATTYLPYKMQQHPGRVYLGYANGLLMFAAARVQDKDNSSHFMVLRLPQE